MSSNTAPFLRTSWQFPDDNPQALSVQIDRAYVAIANNVNARVIGTFPDNIPVNNGKAWFVSGIRYESQQQIFSFTAATSIPHGINTQTIRFFGNCFGSYFDGTNWNGLIFGSSTAIAGQNSFYITPTNIVIIAGAGAPAIVSGVVCLEWVVQL
jgi:hypothetical protein